MLMGILSILALSWFYINHQENARMDSAFYNKIKDGDLVFRSANSGNSSLTDYNAFGIIEIDLGDMYVWDNQNTMKRRLKDWNTTGGDLKFYRITSKEFDINTIQLKNGTYNHIMNSDSLEFIIEKTLE